MSWLVPAGLIAAFFGVIVWGVMVPPRRRARQRRDSVVAWTCHFSDGCTSEQHGGPHCVCKRLGIADFGK